MRKNQGHAEVVIIVIIVVAVLCGLGWVLWNNVINKDDDTAVNGTGGVASSEMVTYTNKQLGFSFDYPRQIMAAAACEQGEPVVTADGDERQSFESKVGSVDVTVLEDGDTFTITQREAPVLTFVTIETSTGPDAYNKDCEMQTVTKVALDAMHDDPSKHGDKMMYAEARSFIVRKLNDESDLANAWKYLPGITVDQINSATYTLKDTDDTNRKEVKYAYDTAGKQLGPDSLRMEPVWYYPAQKLFVSFNTGGADAFASVYDESKYYMQDVMNSFKAL